MNIREMHLKFRIGLDKVMSNQFGSLLPEEVDIALNNAIRRFVRVRFGGNNLYSEGVEGNEKRRDDLRTITITQNLYTGVKNGNKFAFDFPSDYWFLLRSKVGLTGTFCSKVFNGSAELPGAIAPYTGYVFPKTIDTRLLDIDTRLEDPFYKPKSNSRVLTTFENNKLTVYTEDAANAMIELSYIKQPVTVVYTGVDCDLPIHTHEEVIEMAINAMLETMESQRLGGHVQTKLSTIE